ncbi:hypothetical protein Q1W70_10250 [Pseudomonas kielensis]|uniref:hypothetical protein n=1 Tax=Pseudomonas TaxID=286 RepID=UPI0014122F9C|nr:MULTISPECIES: hypothetical protein [Pseudomonas]NBB32512.1 hypothetical protein [Pseudomonas sp. BC115LW]WKL54917.1 hypothetical protein Q1W70_10250 [Pseudomonas kielensis]
MKLDEVEQFALRKLFSADDTSGEARQTFRYQVEERRITATGFFSILRCLHPSEHIQPLQEVSRSFSHPRLKKGGMFVCWVEHDLTLCLEGVAKNSNWPPELIPRALQTPNRD